MTDAQAQPLNIDGADLAALVAAKLCHDFISPAGAIVSGLDLLDDPSAADMRDDALSLIRQSATKLTALVQFARVAFGAATTAERFTGETLKELVAGLTEGGRASLAWVLEETDFSKPAARTLVNLAYLTHAALPTGGEATVTARREGGDLVLIGEAVGARARLKPEAASGLRGERLSEGLQGQWIQPYWLWLTVRNAGGVLTLDVAEGCVVLTARLPR
ncbi:histidine phosphotransferase [Brevundimonas sp. Leaf363]|uniref:histidine phosphotransferase ChpT n=1 Tax=Brevundimonas sp. Leaf363 TaxID=1736353 RepID=UPI000700885A|nr:histidine phosphotransferase family protein [Brevundimonas sp. Leaf363]KQS53743.1 histidine phosphotransferase [Brevundimonas sp. Leaf363]